MTVSIARRKIVPDDEFLLSFQACSLPHEQWNHRVHVKIAFLSLCEHSYGESVKKIRAGIKAFNEANNVSDWPETGYNETTTVASTQLVVSLLRTFSYTEC